MRSSSHRRGKSRASYSRMRAAPASAFFSVEGFTNGFPEDDGRVEAPVDAVRDGSLGHPRSRKQLEVTMQMIILVPGREHDLHFVLRRAELAERHRLAESPGHSQVFFHRVFHVHDAIVQ